MRHKVKKIRVGINKDHRTSLIRNLAMSVIIYEKIKTTSAKAKAVQPFIERLISLAKTKEKREGIREIEKLLQHENSSRKIFEVLVSKYKDRNSGYTRITKLGYRSGDNAPVVQLELV
ncbi:50S ribosomal protein L17 [Candidatus Peregrinibacteria bacterium]|nr:50S ribosomal protein L17 [Candidatus Peregrinibacteria bacterium]